MTLDPTERLKKMPPPKTEAKNQPLEPAVSANQNQAQEIGGASGPEPTRYGDWEKNGRCIDF